jgi:hypothetical protein
VPEVAIALDIPAAFAPALLLVRWSEVFTAALVAVPVQADSQVLRAAVLAAADSMAGASAAARTAVLVAAFTAVADIASAVAFTAADGASHQRSPRY